MALICCTLNVFVDDVWSHKPKWKWGRLSAKNTYIVIFAKHQSAIKKAFNNVKHQVNIIAEIENCTNVIHPDFTYQQGSRNTIVVFEIPKKMGPPKPRKKRVTRSQVPAMPEVPF